MQQYVITLKNEKLKLYYRLSWIIIIIHIIIFLYLALFSKDRYLASWYIADLILIAATFGLKYYLQRKKSKWQIGIGVFFSWLIIGWVSSQQYWLAIIPALFYILSGLSLRTPVITFSEEKINYPSFTLRIIKWKELTNAILKDGLLTIDFRNNKIIQQEIDESKTFINEKEFNEFCNQQLQSASSI